MSEQIDTALTWARAEIEACSDSPRLDAELLLAHCLQKPRSYLYSWPDAALADETWRQFRELVARRTAPTPVAYLLGEREFYSRSFIASPAVLVPRPETELTVDTALTLLPRERALEVLDLGTGSGIIAITIKLERPRISLTATDVDPACLDVARANANRHGVEIEFVQSDWYHDLDPQRSFDLIVSNPPYVAARHPFLRQGDLPAEPQIALTPGDSGLEALTQIISRAPGFLRAGGWIVTEHGYDQQAPLRDLLVANGFDEIHCAVDYNDLPRVTRARLS